MAAPITMLPANTITQKVVTIHTIQVVKTLTEVAGNTKGATAAINLNAVTEAISGQDSQIIRGKWKTVFYRLYTIQAHQLGAS